MDTAPGTGPKVGRGAGSEADAVDNGLGIGGADADDREDEVELVTFPAGSCNGGDGLSIQDLIEIQEYLGLGSGLLVAEKAAPPVPKSSALDGEEGI